MVSNLVKEIINVGGKIKPLIIPYEMSRGYGLMNPSFFIAQDKILMNLRSVGYVFIHSEKNQKFQSRWGPLTYSHPENDPHLRTINFYLELDYDLNVYKIHKVNTENLDIPPVWDFVGLEDARIVFWDNKYFLCGVRRDVKENGEGRMELSEIIITENSVMEISRHRISPPINKDSYCEKNWMPVLDMPYHFIKWTNPTELVEVNIKDNTSTTKFRSNRIIPLPRDLRGGSSVIKYKEHWISITHEVDLFNSETGQKDAIYYHRFVVWDSSWNLINISEDFNFLGGKVEFCCGFGILKDKVLISFGFQDNSAFIVESPLSYIEKFIYG